MQSELCTLFIQIEAQAFIKSGVRRPPGFLELFLSTNVCMHACVCVCVCVRPRGY